MRIQLLPFVVIPVLVLALAVVSTLLVIRDQQSTTSQNNSLRTVICLFERRTIASPQVTAAQKHRAVSIYNQALSAINERGCQ